MSNQALVSTLKGIVGARYVLTGEKQTERFRKGFRSGLGNAIAVVQPGTLLEYWRILQTLVAADKVIILQAANTGLTEGSTPKGDYDRDVVVINTRRMTKLKLLDGGRQVVSLPGATLFSLEKLLQPLNRQPHSVIGSSTIGASIVGGVCNNAGGALCERGPSYTELALYAQIDRDGQLNLINHLDIDLGDTPEEILTRLEAGDFAADSLVETNRKASDTEYVTHIRDVEAATPSRYNADKRRLFEASGCAGKLAVFAVRLDTFPKNDVEATFYIGTNDPEELSDLRHTILTQFETLPVFAEYMHRDLFDFSELYGKDTAVLIDKLGTDRLPFFFAVKGWVDARTKTIPGLYQITDRFMQTLSRFWPAILPKRMVEFRDKYEHHLILKMHDGGIEEAKAMLEAYASEKSGEYFECDARETKVAGLHRFAAAGTAIRYQNLHPDEVEDIVALDVALRRNDRDWLEKLPDHITEKLSHVLYYGHFMCNVFHQDYIVKKGEDAKAIKAEMLELLDQRGAEYPSEHNVGHLYPAKPDLAAFYKDCDPTNSFNPGIGKMSRNKHYS